MGKIRNYGKKIVFIDVKCWGFSFFFLSFIFHESLMNQWIGFSFSGSSFCHSPSTTNINVKEFTNVKICYASDFRKYRLSSEIQPATSGMVQCFPDRKKGKKTFPEGEGILKEL